MTAHGLLVLCALCLASAAHLDPDVPHSRQTRAANVNKKSLIQAERASFVLAHNTARSVATPTAGNMAFMSWNVTLEDAAQKWSLGCSFAHGQPEDFKGQAGQNIWVGTGSYDPEQAVNSWDSEKKDYTHSQNSCNDGAVCGHYTQVVWASSTQVGCGIAHCENIKGFGDRKGYIIVCNYTPPGNWQGQKPYEQGGVCSNCPDGYPTCENKLCRRKPKCGKLSCLQGYSMNMKTCLCDCGGERGAYCAGAPGLAPCVRLLAAGAVLLSLGLFM